MVRLTNALGAEKVLPLTMSFRRVPLDIEVPSQPLYGRDGDVRTGKTTLRTRQFVLEGSIYYPNKERIRQELDSILSFLMHPPVEVYRQRYHDRFLKAYPMGGLQDWLDAGSELQLRIPMVALDPYWYGQEVEVQVSGTQVIEVDGTAPAYPVITTVGSVSGLTISNALTEQTITITDADGVVKVDCYDYTVTADGVPCLNLVNENWLVEGFQLRPGQNEITTTAPITITYRPRWY